jgi:hypothetical protein
MLQSAFSSPSKLPGPRNEPLTIRRTGINRGATLADEFARFLIGGLVVSAFAALGGLFKPTSFAGLFGAAPSVGLATLALTISKDGKIYASTECRSMIAGAVALCLYSIFVSQLMRRFRMSAMSATLSSMPLWFLTAFGLSRIFLR